MLDGESHQRMTLSAAPYCVLENCPDAQAKRSRRGLCDNHEKLARIGHLDAVQWLRVDERSGKCTAALARAVAEQLNAACAALDNRQYKS